MSDPTVDPTPDPNAPAPESEPSPTETVEFWKQKAREQEKRAKANADAAKRLAEIEEAQKTEAEKVSDRMRVLEEERDAAVRDALRFKIASKFEIGDDEAAELLTGTDEETLTRQAEILARRSSDRKKNGNHVPREGTTTPPAGSDEMRDFTRSLFGKVDQ
jgi:hypothetical protein